MTAFLTWIENTAFSTALRDSPNVFLYPTILAFHTLGLAFLVGISSAISLRILGVAPRLPLAPLRKFFPIVWIGFWVNASSGVLLLLVEPTKFLTMPDFYIKLLAIAGAVVCLRLLYSNVLQPHAAQTSTLPVSRKTLASTVLALWGVAITAGRLTAYDDANAQRQTALATLAVSVLMLLVGYGVIRVFRWIRSTSPGRTPVTNSVRRTTTWN